MKTVPPQRSSQTPGPSVPVDFELLDDPIEALREWISTYGDRFALELEGGERALVLTNPEDVRDVIVRADIEKGLGIERVRLLLGNGLMTAEGRTWKGHRRLAQPYFRKEPIRAMRERFAARARVLRDTWLERARRDEPIDVTADTSLFALESVLSSLFGADARRFTDDSAEDSFLFIASAGARDLSFARRFRRLYQRVTELTLERRAAGARADDFLDHLLHAEGPHGALQTRQIVDELMTMIIAGHETTAMTLSSAWLLLASHPAVQERLHAELDRGAAGDPFVRHVLAETLRLYPPGWIVTRTTSAEALAGRTTVEPHTHVLVPIYFVHRHPEHWPDAEAFRPERFEGPAQGRHPCAFIPFGAGARRCIGEHFALLEMERHLVEIAQAVTLHRVDAAPPRLEARVNLKWRDHVVLGATPRSARSRRSRPSTHA